MARPVIRREPTCAVDEVVFTVFGDADKTADACGVTRQSVYVWMGRRMIWNREMALHVEAITAQRNHRVPATELMALVPWGQGRGADKRPEEVVRQAVALASRRASAAGETPATAPLARARKASISRRRTTNSPCYADPTPIFGVILGIPATFTAASAAARKAA